MSKYKNKKVTIDGIIFDSQKEGRRYEELKVLERAKVISGLELQPVFKCEVNGKHICRYIGDFRYVEAGGIVVEDVKSAYTRKLPVYRLKKKLVAALHGVIISEV